MLRIGWVDLQIVTLGFSHVLHRITIIFVIWVKQYFLSFTDTFAQETITLLWT